MRSCPAARSVHENLLLSHDDAAKARKSSEDTSRQVSKIISQPSSKRELKAQLRDAGVSVEMLELLALYLWRSGISVNCMKALPSD